MIKLTRPFEFRDRKHKKFVGTSEDKKTKRIRTEEGTWVSVLARVMWFRHQCYAAF